MTTFGGVDQNGRMASSAEKKAVKQEIKKEVKKEVAKEESKQHKGKKKGKTWKKKEKEFIKKEVKKQSKNKDGPKAKFSVNVTATIGYIDGSTEHGPTLKMATFLHPSLCKGPDEDKAFGPLQAAAAQYGLWRLSKVMVRMTPLVGSSAVSGTVVRLSANLTQTPGSTSWGGLGARKHRDFHAGKAGSFILTRRDVAGPRAGDWWVTDTNTEGAQSAGPVLEAHALGKTSSTYQDRPWKDQLFIVEMTGRWEFTNYNNNPALGALEKHEASVAGAKLTTDANGEIQLEIPNTSSVARFMADPTALRVGQTETPGEIVYQIVDTAAGLAGSTLPPPFNWLIKGGWWFVKKVIGRTNAGNDVYKVYASLADAQNNKPAISTTKSMQGTAVNTDLQVTQMNSPNMGGANANPAISSGGGPAPSPVWPITPHGTPGADFFFLGHLKPVWRFANTTASTLFYPALFEKASVNMGGGTTGQWIPAMHWRVEDPQYLNADGSQLLGWFQPPPSSGEIRIDTRCHSGGGDVIGRVRGFKTTKVGSDNQTQFYAHIVVWDSSTQTNFQTMDQCGCVSFYRPEDSVEIRQKQVTSNVPVLEQGVDDATFVTVFIGKNGSDVWNWPSVIHTDYPYNFVPSGEVCQMLGEFFFPLKQGGTYHVVLDLSQRRRKLTKLERLAQRLGIDPSLLEDSDDEYVEACSNTTDEESSDEEADEEGEEGDFVNVTSTRKTEAYERLRAAGFSHQEAERMSKV